MSDVTAWMEFSKYLGAGAAGILGIVAYKIWAAYQVEISYSKTRDRETLTILNSLTNVIDAKQKQDEREESLVIKGLDDLKREMQSLKELIARHWEK